jgi:hypothetical protein
LPILDAGICPSLASLYTVDFGTRKKWATSPTVRIWPSKPASASPDLFVDANKALFISNTVSALFRKNLSLGPPDINLGTQITFSQSKEEQGHESCLALVSAP